jgi:prepilin-type processing-associated H-X9-DG protein
MTILEVIIVILVLVTLAAVFLPALAKAHRRSSRIGCVNLLKEIGLSYRLWAQDNGDLYPMQVSVTNGGAIELVATGNVVAVFQAMSNELSTPKILFCPDDLQHQFATNFSSIASTNISYFVGLDATSRFPVAFLAGDDNFAVSGAPAKSGRLDISSDSSDNWTTVRHNRRGNIGLVDGSVWPTSDNLLVEKLQATGLATNRLAIP